MKHKRWLRWVMVGFLFMLSVMVSRTEVYAFDSNQEMTQLTEESDEQKTEDETTKETEGVTDESVNQSDASSEGEKFVPREDETITGMDEEGNITEISDEAGLVEIDFQSNDGKIVNFNTKGAVVTSYTEAGTGNLGYTCGAYGADAAYLGTENGQVKFMLSGVTGLVDASEVQVVNVMHRLSVIIL